MRISLPPPSSAFEQAVSSLEEARLGWHKGAPPGLLSRAALSFDEASKLGDERGAVGSALSRALAGDQEGALRRLRDALEQDATQPALYIALGVLLLRSPEPLSVASEAAWALGAARELAPGIPVVERLSAAALCAAGQFMPALQCARTALAADPDDLEAKLWCGLLRLYFGGDVSAAAMLIELPSEAEKAGRSAVFWMAASAGHYARGEFVEARDALARAIAPLKAGPGDERPLADSARRWFREARGFGAGVPMGSERWLRDVGGAHSDYVRTRHALSTLREQCQRKPERAAEDNVDLLALDELAVAMEARTRRGMLEWAARLLLRGFAEAFLPLLSYLEAPGLDLLAAMDLMVLND